MGFRFDRFLMVIIGLLILFAGITGRRLPDFYKGVAIMLMNTVVLFLFIELLSLFVIKLHDTLSIPAPKSVGSANSILPDWASVSWKYETRPYAPWVLWRNIPVEIGGLNINREGIRQTPGADCGPGSFTVFIFGGSTVWGLGAPDWGTIPAYLQSEMANLKDQPVCTINFGQIAYVSTQGMIELMVQLQKGNIPDLVIFYDGINDVYAAYQSGKPCVHENLSDFTTIFNDQNNQPANILVKWMQRSNTFQLIKRINNRLFKAGQTVINFQSMGIDTDSLAESIAKCYSENYHIVGAFAQQYGFKYAFFWQPLLYIGEKSLTSEELDMKSNSTAMEDIAVELYAASYRRIEESAREEKNMYYIANVFDEQVAQIWIDEMHVNPGGNQLVAQRILSELGYRTGGK